MWYFLDKLLNIALPRVRDFRGIPDKGFDGRGNFTLGIKDHTIFPEINMDDVDRVKGMNITIVTSATTDKEGKRLLDLLGMPFKK
jgi:large subunit ribosomal protein L5